MQFLQLRLTKRVELTFWWCLRRVYQRNRKRHMVLKDGILWLTEHNRVLVFHSIQQLLTACIATFFNHILFTKSSPVHKAALHLFHLLYKPNKHFFSIFTHPCKLTCTGKLDLPWCCFLLLLSFITTFSFTLTCCSSLCTSRYNGWYSYPTTSPLHC